MTVIEKRRRRSTFARRHIEAALPERKYQTFSVTKDREDWYVKYDVVGRRAVGSMFYGLEMVRKTFNVKIEGRKFAVDIGTGSGVKVEFIHKMENA